MLLVPVDDSVVFPNMTVTLTVDVGDDERVLLVPREDDEFASVGTVAEVVEHVRLPGGGHAVALAGLHRGIAGAAHTDASRRSARGGHPAPRRRARGRQDPQPRARVPRRGRGDPRAARRRRPHQRLPALDLRAGRPGRHRGLLARHRLRGQGRPAGDPGRDRAPGEGAQAPARPPDRAAGAHARSATTCSRARTSSSASTSCASRWSRSARSSATTTPRWPRSTARRSRRPGCRRPCASRPTRRSTGSSAWASSRARAR